MEAVVSQHPIITIDGPAGTGKSTLGKLLAQRLGYLYFDTGVMYRAVTLVALRQKQDCTDATAMAEIACRVILDVVPPTHDDGRQYTVLADNDDVTWAIREPEIEHHVSFVARHPKVRTKMVRQQKVIGARGGVVMVGRDIGTIVAPGAPLKVYLQTSLEERARRRFAAEIARGKRVSLNQIEQDIARRDALDSHVIQPANDAHILCTDTLTPEDGVNWIMAQFDTITSHGKYANPHEIHLKRLSYDNSR